jgi:GH15 family glucan-1,4-alpha-glucosidase
VTRSCAIKLDHGVIGNGRVLALVSPSSHIDWLCMPRFDSASVFASIRVFTSAQSGSSANVPPLSISSILEDAAARFERLMGFANCVGLFSEDIDPQSEMLLGNFPQAYTHVGLINTAVTISELLQARDARFRAWS